MTAQAAINEVNNVLPHNFDNNLLLTWINRIERTASVEIEGMECDAIGDISENDLEKPLRIPDPYSVIYVLFLQCMIAISLGEFDRYSNIYGIFNASWSDYAKWHLRKRGK